MPRLSDPSNEILAAKLPSTTTLIERLIALGGIRLSVSWCGARLAPIINGHFVWKHNRHCNLADPRLAGATWFVGRPHRDRVAIAARALGTVGVPAIILAPGLGERLVDGIQRLQAYLAGSPELPNWVARVPWAKESVAQTWSSLAEPGSAFQTVIKPYSAELRKGFIELARAFAEGMFQFVVSLAVATMLWLRGDALAGTLKEITERLGGSAAGSALLLAANSVRGVAYGVVGTAAIQAIAMALGLTMTGVPGAGLLGFLTLIIAPQPGRAFVGPDLGRCSLVAFRSRRYRLGHFCVRLGPARLHRRQFHSSLAGKFRSRYASNCDLSWRAWWVPCIRISRSVYRPNIAWRVLPIAPSLA